MTTETYFKILLVLFYKDSVALGFSLAEFFANDGKKILLNSVAQYGTYITATAINNQFTPAILFPFFANSKLVSDYFEVSQTMSGHPERAATVALVYSAATGATKGADISLNAALRAAIATMVDYMTSFTNNGGPVAFGYIRRKRYYRITAKQEFQIHILMVSCVGCIILIFYVIKKLIKASKNFLKKSIKSIKRFKFKRLGNSKARIVQHIKIE